MNLASPVNPNYAILWYRCWIAVFVRAFFFSPVKLFSSSRVDSGSCKWIRISGWCSLRGAFPVYSLVSTVWDSLLELKVTSFSLQFRIFCVAIAHDPFLAPSPRRWMRCCGFSSYSPDSTAEAFVKYSPEMVCTFRAVLHFSLMFCIVAS